MTLSTNSRARNADSFKERSVTLKFLFLIQLTVSKLFFVCYWCGSLLEVLSRSEILYELCDNCSCRTKNLMIITFGKTTYIYKSLNGITLYVIFVRDAPCWDQNSDRVKCFEYKL